ncbi:hypothetical protein MRB53_040593 [Persea americana]|nr:hypothetical protein MRB53_040593 [Persea americana]
MDMHFYSEYIATNDAEPLYDELLQADEVPTWPKTMTHIDLVHMQKWDARGAINLFRSLIESAPGLPDLRYIVLHSHINIPWRDRAGFRDNWTERVFKVFKRRLRVPDPHNNSKRQYEMWKANTFSQKNGVNEHEVKEIEPRPEEHLGEEVADTAATSAIESRPQRRSQRVSARPVRALSSASPSPDEAESSSEDSQMIDGSDELFVQGLCDVVDIRVDNQRPRENQFTEQDFLDTEASGDEDWNENADDEVDEGYACRATSFSLLSSLEQSPPAFPSTPIAFCYDDTSNDDGLRKHLYIAVTNMSSASNNL